MSEDQAAHEVDPNRATELRRRAKADRDRADRARARAERAKERLEQEGVDTP